MTAYEAMDILMSCAFCALLDSDYCCTAADEDCRHAKQMAIEALDKQIAKKPRDVYYGGNFVKMGNCPNCDNAVNSFYQYCAECGQALEWDGVEIKNL